MRQDGGYVLCGALVNPSPMTEDGHARGTWYKIQIGPMNLTYNLARYAHLNRRQRTATT